MAVPISADLPFGGSGGPRGDPPGPVVLPPRVHREPDGGRLRRRPADRPGPEPFRWAAALWGRQDMARSGRRYPGRGDSGLLLSLPFDLLAPSSSWSFGPPAVAFVASAVLSLGALLGDLVGAFVKRRMH